MKKCGMIIRRKKTGHFLKLIYSLEDSITFLRTEYVDRLDQATIFKDLPKFLMTPEMDHIASEVLFTQEVVYLDEWTNLSDMKPKNYEEVTVLVGDIKRRAIWNEELGRFIDHSTLRMDPLDNVTKWKIV